MGPEKPLPYTSSFCDAESYVESLLDFGTSSQLLHTLCGGVHILDFFTRTPDLYSIILPGEWRRWFGSVEVEDVLDLMMRENLDHFSHEKKNDTWRGCEMPPESLVRYITDCRRHLLIRDFEPVAPVSNHEASSRNIFKGMNAKKVHEVENFAKYVDRLATDLEKYHGTVISHIADFGAGQNYLGRVLASKPLDRHIVAIESRTHNVEGAKKMDITTRFSEKPVVIRNKKAFRAETEAKMNGTAEVTDRATKYIPKANNTSGAQPLDASRDIDNNARMEIPKAGGGSVQYIEHRIEDGKLTPVVKQITPTSQQNSTSDKKPEPSLMVISLHSCGNLVHHGLRTLTDNTSVKAVALIGCCYNLMTERLGPPSHKMHLRADHPRLDATQGHRDPHGFPMSERIAKYTHRAIPRCDFSRDEDTTATDVASEDTTNEETGIEEGIRLNITARMMAVQAPQNWTKSDSSSFFTRHFFRALLQRIFLDKGVVDPPPSHEDDQGCSPAGSSWGLARGDGGGTAPLTIGNLSKKCYVSFLAYVRGAVEKLVAGGGHMASVVEERVGGMSDESIEDYEVRYRERKKELSIVWSLMAFSAGVVEAMVVVDRWLWLREQECVKQSWVEPVFDYALSPRNLVVVGIKK